jgi:hypothetical protein
LSTVLNLGRQVHQIDVREQGRTERTSCYILDTKNVAIIETGAAPGIVYLLDALKSLEIAVQRVKYIIVTHIHLDPSIINLFKSHCNIDFFHFYCSAYVKGYDSSFSGIMQPLVLRWLPQKPCKSAGQKGQNEFPRNHAPW